MKGTDYAPLVAAGHGTPHRVDEGRGGGGAGKISRQTAPVGR
jgi:hypothetical protein